MFDEMYLVSQQAYDKLKKGAYTQLHINGMEPMPVASMWPEVKVVAHLPTKKRIGIEQLDRFATYDEADMDWAEPAGLARWIVEEVHCIKVPRPWLHAGYFMPVVSVYRGMIKTAGV